MNRLKILLIFALLLTTRTTVHAQDKDFCAAMDSVIADAGSKFIHLRGAQIGANKGGVRWESNIKIPGVINGRFALSMGLFYEGALFQSKDKAAVKTAYDQYKEILSACLQPKGYVNTSVPNFAKGLEDYKKQMYMLSSDSEVPPPHVSMEVDYYAATGMYTILLYIWEH